MAQRSDFGEFHWFFGVVENRVDDPLQLGRVKVRVLNYHSAFDSDIKTEDLPWATVMLPTTEAASSGVGTNPNGLIDGSWVVGFFKDGKHAQQPVIIGSIPGYNKISENKNKGVDPSQDDAAGSFGGRYQENFGEGFRDRRTKNDLLKYPRKILKLEIPEGCDKQGNDHGIQFVEDKASNYPLDEYKNQVDTNILAINDKNRLDMTFEKYRRLPRSKGGLWDDGWYIQASIMGDKFKCGVTNESGISRAKNISPVLSTAKDFIINNYKPYKETPPALTDGGIRIYNSKNIIE
jgi:hypothetical protein